MWIVIDLNVCPIAMISKTQMTFIMQEKPALLMNHAINAP